MSNESLGLLGRLPGEIRNKIYEHLQTASSKPHLAIFQTNRQLNKEASPDYSNLDLTFQLSPKFDRHQWMKVTASNGAEWQLKSATGARFRGFADLPYHKLRSIKVEIEAIDPAGKGQLIYLYQKVDELSRIIKSTAEKPIREIAIQLMNSKDGKFLWTKNRNPARTVVEEHEERLGFYEYDYEPILLPFSRLRFVGTAKFLTTQTLADCGTFQNDAKRFSRFMQSREAFGERTNGKWEWDNDACLKRELDEVFLIMDHALDFVEGPTGNMLRLERFAEWFDAGEIHGKSTYMERLQAVHDRGFDKLDVWQNTVEDIKWRWRCMVAFNPLSRSMQRMKSEYEITWKYGFNLATIEGICRSWHKIWNYNLTLSDCIKAYLKQRNQPVFYEKGRRKIRDKEPPKAFGCVDRNTVPEFEENWDKDEWWRLYPEGIPCLIKGIKNFETYFGYEPQDVMRTSKVMRMRFEKWDDENPLSEWQIKWQDGHEQSMRFRWQIKGERKMSEQKRRNLEWNRKHDEIIQKEAILKRIKAGLKQKEAELNSM